MARKAIELTDSGIDIWHSVNPVNIESPSGKRGDELAVSYQTAIVVDIDIRSAAHKENAKALADFDIEKNSALERLKNVETFDSDSIFSNDVLTAPTFAKLFDKKVFSDFKSEITLFNRKTKEKKASVNEWSAAVRYKVSDITSKKKMTS